MACGLPIVGLLADGVRDLVENERTGLLLDDSHLSEEEQIISYRVNLERLVTYKVLRHAMGQAALKEAQQRSWPEAMECLVRGYDEAIMGARTLIVA
jgi:glycosyltransferase involved in cell wall biosynthesis